MPYLLTESSKPIIENIQNGGIAIFPTDTVYGIGCKMSNRGGVEEIYRLKNRPVNMSIAVLVNSIESASEIGKLDEAELKALEAFWPGALTVVVEAKTDVTIFGISSDNSVGLRYPNQQLISEIIFVTGPLATTSLNLHGQKPVTQPVEVMEFIKATELNCKSEIPAWPKCTASNRMAARRANGGAPSRAAGAVSQ